MAPDNLRPRPLRDAAALSAIAWATLPFHVPKLSVSLKLASIAASWVAGRHGFRPTKSESILDPRVYCLRYNRLLPLNSLPSTRSFLALLLPSQSSAHLYITCNRAGLVQREPLLC